MKNRSTPKLAKNTLQYKKAGKSLFCQLATSQSKNDLKNIKYNKYIPEQMNCSIDITIYYKLHETIEIENNRTQTLAYITRTKCDVHERIDPKTQTTTTPHRRWKMVWSRGEKNEKKIRSFLGATYYNFFSYSFIFILYFVHRLIHRANEHKT